MAVNTEDWQIASSIKEFREVLTAIPRQAQAADEVDQIVTGLDKAIKESTRQLRIAKYRYEIACAQESIARKQDAINHLLRPEGDDDE